MLALTPLRNHVPTKILRNGVSNLCATLRQMRSNFLLFSLLIWLRQIMFHLLLAVAVPASAIQVQDGSDRAGQVLWPAVQVLHDIAGNLTWEDALRAGPMWHAPSGPLQNLGRKKGVVWLYVSLEVGAAGDPRSSDRVLAIDYPTLSRVELRHFHELQLIQAHQISSATPFLLRPLPARSLAFPLSLRSGQNQLLLRIESTTTLVLPIALHTQAGFVWQESKTLAGLALLIGPMLLMGLYGILQGVARRDALFLLYSLVLAGNAAYLLGFTGIGSMLVWPGWPWLSTWIAPFGVLLTVAAGTAFLRNLLPTGTLRPWLDRALRQVPLLAALAASLTLLGLIPHQHLQWFAAVLGTTSMGAVTWAAWPTALRRDATSLYVVCASAIYFTGAGITVSALAGLLPAQAATMHAYSLAMLLEVIIWLAALSLRARQLAAMAAQARSESERLKDLTMTDPLTGLPNRRGLQERLSEEIARVRSPDSHGGLVLYLMDLDGFKPVNDVYGHAVGDDLLRALGPRLRQALPGAALIARLGGDEFVVLVPGVRQAEIAESLGQAMLAAVAQAFHLEACAQPIHIGLTIGYALAPQDSEDPAQLMALADQAMYQGKRSGGLQLRRTAGATGLVESVRLARAEANMHPVPVVAVSALDSGSIPLQTFGRSAPSRPGVVVETIKKT